MDSATQMKKIDDQIINCTLCRLAKGRTRAVPGTGPKENVQVVLVGEAPGRNEDLEGKPFVGAGGKLLDSLLTNAGLRREDVYITNIVKCRPPENRKPLEDEVKICTSNYLDEQLALLKPKLVCTLGATALEYFTGKKRMGEARGMITKAKGGFALLPTYHPAAVFRNPSYRELLQEDLKKIPRFLVKSGQTKLE
jgi:uracil-DNA glycosylase